MNQKIMFQTIWVLSILLFTVGCATSTQTPTITLTINENESSFNGPKTIPYGEFFIKLAIIEQKPSESGYALITLEDGKTIEDLEA